MRHISHVRVALVAVLFALVMGASPALAKTEISHTGTRGNWSLKDTHRKPGVTCDYSIYGDLYQIKAKAPKVFGSHAGQTWVGWKYKIMRSTGSRWHVIDRSDVQKDMASRTAAADGFSRRVWDGFGVDPPANARYKVRLVILFYAPGSTTAVEGKVVVEDDWYKETYPTWAHPYKHADYCSDTPD